MQKYLGAIFIVALLAATFATLPRVDYAEANVFFYLQHLTPLYHVTIIVSIAMAIYWRRSYLGLLSVIVLGLLIFLTPSIMLVQPWFPDTYPFVGEAVYITRNGHLGDFHYLSVNPVLGLFFGPLLMITGMSPFVLIKIYPALIAVIFSVALYLIAKKVKIVKEGLVVAPLLFFSIAWPNEFHLSRQSFSLIFYLASWLLLSRLIFSKPDRRFFVLLVAQIVILTMSHPATPLFFMINLVAILAVSRILPKSRLDKGSEQLIFRTLIISAVSWILWNSYNPTGPIYSLESFVRNFVESLLESPGHPEGAAKIFVGYTSLYGSIIDLRLALTLVALGVVGLSLLIVGRNERQRKLSLVTLGWLMSNMFTAIPLLYAGLPYSSRPILFSIIPYALAGALIYEGLTRKQNNRYFAKLRRTFKVTLIIGFILVPALLIPVIKYGPLPFLYPTSKELANKYFLDSHVVGNETIIYLEYNIPWGYSYVLDERLQTLRETRVLRASDVYVPGEGLNVTLAERFYLWVTSRLTTRDGFSVYTPSMSTVAEQAVQKLPENASSKVYDSGGFNCILVPKG